MATCCNCAVHTRNITWRCGLNFWWSWYLWLLVTKVKTGHLPYFGLIIHLWRIPPFSILSFLSSGLGKFSESSCSLPSVNSFTSLFTNWHLLPPLSFTIQVQAIYYSHLTILLLLRHHIGFFVFVFLTNISMKIYSGTWFRLLQLFPECILRDPYLEVLRAHNI